MESRFTHLASTFNFQLSTNNLSMPQREFEITIAPDGSVELHVKGYKGKSCLEAMKIFEQVVGEMKSRRETSEFYEPDEQVRFNIEQRH
jgi:Protein of unknown function (DUF2997)